VELKRDGLCDADIIAAIGVHPSTFYRWLKDGEEAKTRVKRALYDELKGAMPWHGAPPIIRLVLESIA